jgi:hypothetical protein
VRDDRRVETTHAGRTQAKLLAFPKGFPAHRAIVSGIFESAVETLESIANIVSQSR